MKIFKKLLFALPLSLVMFGCSNSKTNSKSTTKDNNFTTNNKTNSNSTTNANITTENKNIDSDYVFGMYPQSEETNKQTIQKLNSKAGNLPTSENKYNWTSYDYYCEGLLSRFMWYQDIDLDDNGTIDYRGVYFTQYREASTQSTMSSNSYQQSNGFKTKQVYWYKYEPIGWTILEDKDEKLILISDSILDSQDFCYSKSIYEFSHNGGSGYGNNYELSDIRRWLNNNFLNTAFNETEREKIVSSFVDNSSNTTNKETNSYSCNSVNDKVYLLSYADVNRYYADSSNRSAFGTGYAKCQGLYTTKNSNSSWLLRSPYGENPDRALCVDTFGDAQYATNVFNTSIGIRPVICINK